MNNGEVRSTTSTITSVSEAHALPPGTVLAQRYRIENLVGIGGMGMVYRATDLSLGVDVALKLLRPELSGRAEAFERFRHEVLLARQVSSPHVLRIHDIARDDGHWFISMDYVDGESLDRVLDRDGPMPVERALAITAQIATGLAAAHAQHVVHRDLKPSNVLLDARGNAVIADFGIARSLGGAGLTHTGAVVGTPDYLSPEQARGGQIDARSDLYTLGLLLYEMLVGQLPFAGSTSNEAISQRMSGHLVPVERRRRDVPAWVARLVARLLKPTPAHRFQSADQVIAAIAARRVARDWRPLLRRGGIAVVGLALLAAVVIWMPRPGAPVLQPPPDRILVLPVEFAGRDLQRPALAALGEHVRTGLAAVGGPAVVDGERTTQALARTGQAEGDPVDDALLLQELPARGSIRLRLGIDGGGYRMQADWRDGKAALVGIDSGHAQPTPMEAAEVLVLRLRERLGAPTVAIATGLMPANRDALEQFGTSLLQRRHGQVDAALREFEAAVAMEPAYASAWLGLAETARLAGDPARASVAISRGRALPSPALAGEFALLELLHVGDWEAAERRLRSRLDEAPDDLFARLQLAEVLGERGEYQRADAMLEELLERDPGEARAWFLRGKFAILRGRAQPAVDEYLMHAVLLFKRYRNRFGEAEAVNALGVGFARLGQIDDAEEQYRKALELREAIGHRRGIASSLRNLAQLATIRGQLGEAGRLLDRARELFERIEDRAGLAAVDNELGLIAEERGDHAQALDAFRRALRSRESLGDRRGAAESMNNIGFAHYQLGDYDSARVFWQQASDAFLQADDLIGATRTAQNLGLLEIVRGRWDDARRQLERSLATAERQQMVEEAGVSRRNLAELALVEGRLGDALSMAERAQELFGDRQDLRGVIDALMLRGRALLAAGAIDGASAIVDQLDAMLVEASAEQRALGAVLRAELARERGDLAAARAALEEAQREIAEAGSRAVRLHIEVAAGRTDAALGDEIRALGHRPLWLLWAEQAMRDRRDPEAVLALWQEADLIMREGGRYEGAWRLHRLAAAAWRKQGDIAAADAAETRADDAVFHVRQSLPASLRAGFDAHVWRADDAP